MSNSYKMSVSLASIVPGANPRKDFGDIDRIISEHVVGPASMWETLVAMSRSNLGWAKWTVTWLPPAIDEGSFTVKDEDLWLLEQARMEV